MQDLRSYLRGKPKADFAKQVGIVPAYLSQIMSGRRFPSYALMMRIEEATDGAVPLDAWKSASEEGASQ